MPTQAPTPTAVVVAPTPTPAAMMAEHFDPFTFASANGDRPRRGGIMKGSLQENLAHHDFHMGTSANIVMQSPLYNGLLMTDPYDWQNAVLPDLAHTWETSSDGTRLTFHLHEGIEWHDGTSFTSADAKFSLERILFSGLVAGNTDNKGAVFRNAMWPFTYDSVEAPDPKTVVVNLKGSTVLGIQLIADGYSKILPKHIGETNPVQAYKDDLSPVGTGPVRLVGEIGTTLANFERNPDYFKPNLPWTDGYEAHLILDVQTRATAVLTQRIFWDNITALPFVGFEAARAIAAQDSGIIHEGIQGFQSFNMFLVPRQAPLDDKRIRQAISEAIDRANLVAFDPLTGIEGLGEGRGVVGSALPPFGDWVTPLEIRETFIGYGPDMEVRRARARELIADYKADTGVETIEFDNNCMTQHVSCEAAQLVKEDLRKVGIEMNITPGEIVAVFLRTLNGELDATQWFVPHFVHDPSDHFGEAYHTGGPRAFGGKPAPARLDELWEQQLFLPRAEREEIAWEMDRIVQEDANIPILYWGMSEHLRRDFVKGWSWRPFYFDSLASFEYVWLDLPELPFASAS